MSPYAYTWNDPVNYSDPSGMIGERIGDPGGPDPNKIYGPKGGTLIEGVTITITTPMDKIGLTKVEHNLLNIWNKKQD
jgi:hypothetical protein